MNMFNLLLKWRWSLKLEHGYHPTKDEAIYEYWQAGPVELQSYFRNNTEILNLDTFRSNNKNTCVDCGVEITEENDSGWEAFVEDGTLTQKQCIDCDKKYREVVGVKYEL